MTVESPLIEDFDDKNRTHYLDYVADLDSELSFVLELLASGRVNPDWIEKMNDQGELDEDGMLEFREELKAINSESYQLRQRQLMVLWRSVTNREIISRCCCPWAAPSIAPHKSAGFAVCNIYLFRAPGDK